MLYGRPQKLVRHVDETTITLEPQRFYVHTCWKYDHTGVTARTDGQDLQDEKVYPEGSIIKKHKMEILVTPETNDPQQLYIARLKLSFHDVYSWAICGGRFDQASYLDTSTENFDANGANPITPHLYPDVSGEKVAVEGADTANQELGAASSGYGISEAKLDDHLKHFLRWKKVTVFNQSPLMGERWQRVPSKCKRINEGTYYGLVFFNDSPRGATAADTQLTINLKEYIEEKAI